MFMTLNRWLLPLIERAESIACKTAWNGFDGISLNPTQLTVNHRHCCHFCCHFRCAVRRSKCPILWLLSLNPNWMRRDHINWVPTEFASRLQSNNIFGRRRVGLHSVWVCRCNWIYSFRCFALDSDTKLTLMLNGYSSRELNLTRN